MILPAIDYYWLNDWIAVILQHRFYKNDNIFKKIFNKISNVPLEQGKL